jgi:hypothetical protein
VQIEQHNAHVRGYDKRSQLLWCLNSKQQLGLVDHALIICVCWSAICWLVKHGLVQCRDRVKLGTMNESQGTHCVSLKQGKVFPASPGTKQTSTSRGKSCIENPSVGLSHAGAAVLISIWDTCRALTFVRPLGSGQLWAKLSSRNSFFLLRIVPCIAFRMYILNHCGATCRYTNSIILK